MKKIKKQLIPVLGITSLATISAPIIACCSCSAAKLHCWYSPVAKREVVADHNTNTGTFVLVVDSENYKHDDFDIKITGNNKGILSLDSFKVNKDTIEVVVKCLVSSKSGKIPFGLTVTHKEWTQDIEFLTLVASVAVTSVSVTGPTTITYGTSETYTATVYDTSGKEMSDEEVEWHVDESAGGKIDRTLITGNQITLKGIGAGKVTLTATSKTVATIVSDPLTIEIKYEQPTDLTLTPATVSIRMDQNETIRATVLPEEKTHQSVSWAVTTGNEVIDIQPSTAGDSCVILPKATGNAVVTATTLDEGGTLTTISKTCAITITAPLAKTLTLSPQDATLWNKEAIGGALNTLTYSAKTTPDEATDTVKWSITKGNASIDADSGKLTLDGATNKDITVKAIVQDEGKLENTTNLTVKYILEDFVLTGNSTIRGNVDGTTFKFPVDENNLTPTYASWDANSTKWYLKVNSGESDQFSIDESTGEVTAKAAGVIEVWATRTTHDGAITVPSQHKTITVQAPLAKSVTVDTSPTAGITTIWNTDSISTPITYNTQQYVATVTPTTSSQTVKWSVLNDPEGISITEDGGLLSLTGDASAEDITIKALTQDSSGKYGTKDLHINYALETFTVTGDNTVRVRDGGTHKYVFDTTKGCTTTPSNATYDASSIKWYSSDTTIATIGETTGELTPVKAGTVNIHATMTTHDGTLTATSSDFAVTVEAPWSESVTVDTNPTGITEIWNTDDETGANYNTIDFDATVGPEGASQTVKWTKDASDVTIDENTGVVTLDENTASDSVTATATAQDGGGKSGSKKVNIKYVLKSFSIKGDTTVRTNGATSTYTIVEDSIVPSNAKYVSEGYTSWSSSDTDVADFENPSVGTLTGKKAGTTKITATVYTHVNDSQAPGEQGTWTVSSVQYPVQVLPPYANSIEVTGETDRTIWNDQTSTFKATVKAASGVTETPSQAVTWAAYSDQACTVPAENVTMTTSSTDYMGTLTPNIATTTSTNNVVYVQASATDSPDPTNPVKSTACKVTIKIPLEEFKIKSDGTEARVGESSQPTFSVDTTSYKPTGASPDATAAVFSVDDTSIATIDESTGLLSPVKAGTVKVTAVLKTHDGTKSVTSDELEVTVMQPYTTSLTITGESLLWTDETSDTKLTMKATYQPSEAKPAVTWSSSNSSAATIDESSGKLTLVGNGDTTITAKANDGSGKEATHTLTVKIPATSVAVTSGETELKVADETKGSSTYGCTVTPSEAAANGTIVWSVSDDSLATINSSTGLMEAKAKGEVYVYAAWTATGRTDVKSAGYKVTIEQPDITGLTINGLSTIPLSDGSTQYTVTADPTGASALSNWAVYDDEDCTTVSTKATITPVTGDATKADLEVTVAGEVWIKATSQALSSVSSPAFKVTITTAWTDIFEIGQTGELANDTVMGFKSGLAASTLQTYCTSTGDLSFPNITSAYPNVTKINAEAFKDVFDTSKFPGLANIVKKISIPANIKEIGDNAFDNFAGVTNLEISGSTSIGDQAFINCSSLTTINALNVTSVGEKAFYNDDAISTINFGTNANLEIGDYAFADIYTDGTTVTLTANPKTIGSNAFAETTNLVWTGINNVTAITSIGEMAFSGCQLLPTGTTLTVNDKLAKATVGDAAFYATGIESIILPAQTSDEMYANWGTAIFGDCESLTSIDISAWATGVPSNLSSATRLFVYAGGPSPAAGTCKWYYKSGIDATVITALTTWMTAQIGEENIGNWTATAI